MPIFSSSIPGDEEIIRLLQENTPGKRQAENELFTRYLYFINEGIKKYSLNEEEAFTAYSDTILNALNNISKSLFESRSSLKTYLFKIYNNKCVDLIRKKTTNKSSIHQTAPVADLLELMSDRAKNVLQQLIEKNDIDFMRTKLKELGGNCRELLLFFSEGCKDKDISTFMGYKGAEVVKTTRMRCLEKLRVLYQKK